MDTTPKPLLYGINDAAKVLGVGRSTIYRMIHEGTLEARQFGSRILIPAAAIEAFAETLPKFERATS